MTLTFGSAFAGIGGFELGLERAGWECKWQIENSKACNKILEKHWPNIKRYGDIENVKTKDLEGVTLICGGFPCQDLSVAGKRKGLSGGRSSLFWELVRVIQGVRPKWILIENVPGFLSSHKGEDFAIALQTLAECGYGLAWRILDSQYFGVPQRRRRVFIVGYLGAICPPEILFESEGGKGDIAKSGKSGEDIAHCLTRRTHKSGDPTTDQYIVYPLRAGRTIADSGGNQGNIIAFESRIRGDDGRGYEREPRIREDGIAWTIQAAAPGNVCAEANPNGVREASGVPQRVDLPVYGVKLDLLTRNDPRRQMGVEKELSQTMRTIGPHGVIAPTESNDLACPCPDSPRYRALGNAVTVQVAEWIGRRIKNYEDLYW